MYNPISLTETWHIYKNNRRLYKMLFEMDNTLDFSSGGFKGCLPNDVMKVKFEPTRIGIKGAEPDHMIITYFGEEDVIDISARLVERDLYIKPDPYDGRTPLEVYSSPQGSPMHDKHARNLGLKITPRNIPNATVYTKFIEVEDEDTDDDLGGMLTIAEIRTDENPEKILAALDEYSRKKEKLLSVSQEEYARTLPTLEKLNGIFNLNLNKVALGIYMHERSDTGPLTYDQITKDTGVSYQGVLRAVSFLLKRNLVELKDDLSGGINIHKDNRIQLTTSGINQVETLLREQLPSLETYMFND